MRTADVIVAGGGVSGLLVASAFSSSVDVVLLEQQAAIPQNKYWLTDRESLLANPDLGSCVDKQYESLDFVAYDDTTARVRGQYCLWHSGKLVEQLLAANRERGTDILIGRRLYSLSREADRVLVRANDEVFQAKVLIDCMGLGSPVVTSKGIVDVAGYYIVHGQELTLKEDLPPVGLANVVLGRRPAYFELFPSSSGTAHAALILPSTEHRPGSSLKSEWTFIVSRSHYKRYVEWTPESCSRSYFGIIPVGRLRTIALDRTVFFGEAGQANPAASATGLTRMLRTFRALAAAIEEAIARGRVDRRALIRCLPKTMSRANRLFQECLFERILTFTSDDFRRLVQELACCPDRVVSDLIFADFDFLGPEATAVAAQIARRPTGILGRTVARMIVRSASRLTM